MYTFALSTMLGAFVGFLPAWYSLTFLKKNNQPKNEDKAVKKLLIRSKKSRI